MKIVAPPASDLDRGGQRVAEYIALFHNGIDIAELYYIYAHRDAVRHQETVTVSSSSLSSHRSQYAREASCPRAEEITVAATQGVRLVPVAVAPPLQKKPTRPHRPCWRSC
jgi:hypothetical protein